MRVYLLLALAAAVWGPSRASAQDGAALARAEQAFQELDYPRALAQARLALSGPLERSELIRTQKLIALSLAVLDSTAQAITAFQQVAFLEPDYRPNPDSVNPRIVTLHQLAVSQTLSIHDFSVDTADFVEGEGAVEIRFAVSRPAAIRVSLNGQGRENTIRVDTVAGDVAVRWSALTAEGQPVSPGWYQIIVLATEGQNTRERAIEVLVAHRMRDDTLPWLDSLPGYQPLPETAVPERSFTPLLGTVVAGALLTAAVFSLTEQDVRTEAVYSRPELVTINLWALAAGLALSLRRPDPQPVEANRRWNRLLREELVRRNEEIRAENHRRRQQVRIRVEPTGGA